MKGVTALMKPDPTTRVDLHIHTSASDGTWSPRELIEKIKEVGISLFAVTDHDTVANVAEASRLAKEEGLYFLPGVEITAVHQGIQYHILGLDINPSFTPLLDAIAHNKELMDARDDAIITELARQNTDIRVEDYASYANDPRRGGWKALNYLVDKGLCTSFRDFPYLPQKPNENFDLKNFISAADVVRLIYAAGGKPVLAHPGASFYTRDYRKLLKDMAAYGIAGVECFHPDNNEEITAYSLEFCRENGLLITGGSDCHGSFHPGRRLGYPDVRFSQLRLSFNSLPDDFNDVQPLIPG